MTLELSRFVHSLDDALAELGAGHHGRPDPLVCWTTLELVLVRRRTGPAGDGKGAGRPAGNSSEASFDKQLKANGRA